MAFCSKLGTYRILSNGTTYGKILLVGEDQQDGIPQLILVEHALQFLPSLDDTIAIVAVDDEDDTWKRTSVDRAQDISFRRQQRTLSVLEVMSPQRPNLVLTTDIPDSELDVLVLYGLNIEALMRSMSAGLNCHHMPRGWRLIPMVGMVVTISPSLSL